jgi:plastocyanin
MRGEGFARRGVLSVVGRERFLFPLAALLGAAAVVLPAVASSEASPTIAAVNYPGGGYYESHAWSPVAATVAAGGTVTLKNESATVPHGVRWVNPPATPACTGVPVGTAPQSSATGWSGTCTFTAPGTYTFYCTVHGAEMTGTITVTAGGATGATGTTPGGPAGTITTGTVAAPGAPEP